MQERPAPPPDLDAAAIEAALPDFMGTYLQTPPPFSAKKIGGVPAYKLARRNKPVVVAPVTVTVHGLTLERYDQGLARLRVVSSSGFYVRSLAHGLGERLGCGAHLEALRRTRAGEFTLDQAVTLDDLERLGAGAAARMVAMSSLLPLLPRVVVTEGGARRAAHGNALTPRDLAAPLGSLDGSRVRVLDPDGTLLGIAEPTGDGAFAPCRRLV